MGHVNRQFSAGDVVNVKIEHGSMKAFFSLSNISCAL